MDTSDAARETRRGRARVGFLLMAASALIGGAAFLSDLLVRATLEGARITVLAHSAAGLAPGSPVWLAGRPVGRVLSISFRADEATGSEPDGPRLVIEGVIDRAAEPLIRADATAQVRPPDLLAPVVVALSPGSGAAPRWNFADTLRATAPPLNPETVVEMADSLLASMRRAESWARLAAEEVAAGGGSVARFRADPDALVAMADHLDVARGLVLRDLPRSSLSRLAADTLVAPTARRARERLDAWAASSGHRSARAGLRTASAATGRVAARAGSLVQRVQRGEGTAGRALRDGEIRRQLAALRLALAELAEDLGDDPSRWLRVRVF